MQTIQLEADFIGAARQRYPYVGEPEQLGRLLLDISLENPTLAQRLDSILIEINQRLVPATNPAPESTHISAYDEAVDMAAALVAAGKAPNEGRALTMIWEMNPRLYERHIMEISR